MRAAIALVVILVGCGGSSVDGASGAAGTDGGVTAGAGGAGATAGSSAGGSSGAATGGTAGAAGATSGGAAGSATGGSAGSATSVDCNPNTAVCTLPPPQCSPGEVPSVTGGCWGPCVPILQCATEPDCSTCTSGFCAQYVAFTTEYRCVLPSIQCSALACSCLAQYFCVDPYSACSTSVPGQGSKVSCECTSC
jgi:hypothetical protein